MKLLRNDAMWKIAFLVVLIGVFYLSTLWAGQRWDDDFAMYIHHAKNIALGIDYSNTGYIYDRQYPSLGPKTYPPIFPLLLAGVYKGFGLNLKAMKVEVILLFLTALLLVAFTFREELSTKQLLALVAMTGFSPYFWNFKENIVSDLPFLMFIYLSLVLYRTYEEHRSPTNLNAAVAGFMSWVAYGTRSIGASIIAALWLRDVIRLRKLSHFSLILTGMFLLGVGAEMLLVHTEASYFDQFRAPLAPVAHAVGYLRSFSALWDNGYSKPAGTVVLGLLSALAAIGFSRRLRSKVTIFEAFFITYVVTIVVWPVTADRFIIPLVPLYFFYILVGLKAAMTLAGARQRNVAVALVAILVMLSYAGKYSRSNYATLDGIGNKAALDLFEFVRSKTNPNDIFIFRRPRALALFTDRESAVYHWTATDNELWNYFCEVRATHIIAGALDDAEPPLGAPRGFLTKFVDKYSGDLQDVHSNAEFKVYRIATKRCGPTTNVTAARSKLAS